MYDKEALKLMFCGFLFYARRKICLMKEGLAMGEEAFMLRAVELAKKGIGHVNPNPLVGAVIVKDGAVIGEGYHAHYGGLHAERNALADCKEPPRGATAYVTLEPCCHYGKTPPCTQALVENGIAKVVVGSDDPNPLVAGKGIQYLREHGVEVVRGVCKEACDALNPVFFHYIKTKTPYVAMKYAMTMDGKIACYTGASKWITGEAARVGVQQLRNAYMGIMAGIGTVLADDPLLTCRMPGGRNPIRIICDTNLRIPLDSRLVQTARETPLLIAAGAEASQGEKVETLRELGCECVPVPEKDGRVDLKELMAVLGARGIDGILLEGGAELNWSALQCGIVKKAYCFIAPKIFGGGTAKSPVGGRGAADPSQAFFLKKTEIRRYGDDLCLESEVSDGCLPES